MKKILERFGILAIALVAMLGMAQAQNQTSVFTAQLAGDNVVPAVETNASGLAVGVLIGNTLHVGGSYTNLSTPVATNIRGGVHIHMGASGENGPIVFELTNTAGMEGTLEGIFELSDEQMQALMDGNLYVQIHTEMHGPGEIRGQMTSTTAPEAASTP